MRSILKKNDKGLKMKKILGILPAFVLASCAGTPGPLKDIRILDTQVFPESITSMRDGTVLSGSVKGIVYRTTPGGKEAREWIHHSPENGILTILGVLADEASNTLWLCSVPNFFGPERSEGQSAVMAFDLGNARQKGVYYFPEGGTCNDITVDSDGTVYATDTPNGRILALDPGSSSLRVYGQSDLLRGIDGIAFSEDGTLYANNVQTSKLYRVAMNANDTMGALTELQTNIELGGPDSMRLIEGNRFIQAESGIGRLSVVTIEGDRADITVIDETVESSPGATVVGDVAYVIESNIQYLFNPELRGQEPEGFWLKAHRLP